MLGVRDVLVLIAQQYRTRWGLFGRWTLFDDAFYVRNADAVTYGLKWKLWVSDGGSGLRLTHAGYARMNGR